MVTNSSHRRVLIAASGTGGHLFPARYVGEALRKIEPNIKVEFVGAGKPLEAEIIDKAGFTRHVIPAVGLKRRGIKGAFQFLATLPGTILKVAKIFSALKPQVVIGVGGYATFVPITIAKLKGIPTWIHEAEREAGMANSVLSRYATRISVAFDGTKFSDMSKVIVTGHPVRPELLSIEEDTVFAREPSRLLILGGSQGADALDKVMIELLDFVRAYSLSIWHQCREENVERLKSEYRAREVEARVESFIQDMGEAYTWADIIIARSGAGTVMEIGVANIPTIFVPYPFQQGNHQTANARVLSDQGKAVIVDQGEDFDDRLKAELTRLLNKAHYVEVKRRPSTLRIRDAAERIANGALGLIKK